MINKDSLVKFSGFWLWFEVFKSIGYIFSGFINGNIITSLLAIFILSPLVYYLDSIGQIKRERKISATRKKRALLSTKIFLTLYILLIISGILLGTTQPTSVSTLFAVVTLVASSYYFKNTSKLLKS